MSNESQDKKDTVPDVPSARSYPTEGVPPELDPGALQVQVISTDNPNDVALPASTPAATTQPSLRRMQRALLPQPVVRRGRGVQVILVLLGFAIVWEVAMLVRTSLGTRESRFTQRGQPGPSASVQVSSARPTTAETSEPVADLPAPASPEAQAEALPIAKQPDEPAAAARSSIAPASAPRAPALLQDLEPSVHQEANVRPKLDIAEAPQPPSSSKSPSKVLFPPQ